MILRLHDVYDPSKVSLCHDKLQNLFMPIYLLMFLCLSLLQINVKIKVVSGSPCGAVAAEAKKTEANWVVLDK